MRISSAARFALSALAGAAFLAACSNSGGSQTTGYAPAGGAATGAAHVRDSHFPASTSFRALKNVHPDHKKSWVSPDVAKAPRLLFVSDDDTNDVYIFTMPAMALKGTLTGFSEPQGMCNDSSGNIWITSTSQEEVIQYSRTGTSLKSVSTPGYFPVGCAVNKTNGDLAVTNIVSTAGGDGNVMIFHNGSGTGTPITNPSQTEYFFPAYDKSGNLYVDGFGNSGFILSGCGSSSCSTITVSGGSVGFPGGMNWDRVNDNLIIGDQECATGSCEDAATISGSTATITHSTPVNNYDGSACDVDQGTIAPMSKYFAGPCITQASALSSAARWAYPAGGTPGHFNNSVVEFPIGSAISNK